MPSPSQSSIRAVSSRLGQRWWRCASALQTSQRWFGVCTPPSARARADLRMMAAYAWRRPAVAGWLSACEKVVADAEVTDHERGVGRAVEVADVVEPRGVLPRRERGQQSLRRRQQGSVVMTRAAWVDVPGNQAQGALGQLSRAGEGVDLRLGTRPARLAAAAVVDRRSRRRGSGCRPASAPVEQGVGVGSACAQVESQAVITAPAAVATPAAAMKLRRSMRACPFQVGSHSGDGKRFPTTRTPRPALGREGPTH